MLCINFIKASFFIRFRWFEKTEFSIFDFRFQNASILTRLIVGQALIDCHVDSSEIFLLFRTKYGFFPFLAHFKPILGLFGQPHVPPLDPLPHVKSLYDAVKDQEDKATHHHSYPF